MNSHKKIFLWLLFMLACAPLDIVAADHNDDNTCTHLVQRDKDRYQACLDLQDTLRDKDRSQKLLRDRSRIHNMLKQRELRQEMLQHPRFMRQMMQIREMRQELLGNEQMMHEMLQSRDIHREINRSREMMEGIEKNETYRQENQDLEADILKELLLEPTASGAASVHP